MEEFEEAGISVAAHGRVETAPQISGALAHGDGSPNSKSKEVPEIIREKSGRASGNLSWW